MIKKILVTVLAIFAFGASVFAKDDIKVDYNQKFKFHIYKIDLNALGDKVKPYVEEEGLKSTSDVFKENDFLFAVNAGFFDLISKKSVSYVTIDGKTVVSPFDNLSTIQNLARDNRLEKVLNRSEFRVLENVKNGKLKFDIANHFIPVEKGYKLRHAIQGGPIIEPDMDLEAEGFVKVDSTGLPKCCAADVLKRRARTIIALKDNFLYVVIYTKFSPVTISEARGQLEKYKFDKIMAFDGGASTSLNYKDTEIYTSTGNSRNLKSFLVIEK